jgi:Na+:H+ antiporter
MPISHIFGLVAILLIVAFTANRLSKLTRVPDIIVLLLIGITVGPLMHWVHAATFQGAIRILGTFALLLILFEGGLELRLRQALRYFPAGLLLAFLSFGLSLGLIAISGRYLLHLGWTDCLLLGAALGCTSGTIVIPALQQINTPDPIKITLTIESALGEIIAVVMVGSLLNASADQSLVTGLAMDFSHHIVVSVLIGFLAGALWSRVWPRIAGQPNANILNLGVLMGIYAIGKSLHGSGLLAALIFGVTLANLPRTPHMTRQGARLLAFHAEFSFLVRSFFFVLLGVVAEFIGREYIVPILGILVSLVAARYLAVLSSRRMIRDVTPRDTELLFWMLPRGLVTAVLALEIVNVRGAVFSFLPAMAFTVVLVTNLFIVWGAVRASRAAEIQQAVPSVAVSSAVEPVTVVAEADAIAAPAEAAKAVAGASSA